MESYYFRSEGLERHVCTSKKKGDWIFFSCSECDYLRKMNPFTNEIKLLNPGDENALHQGMHAPVGLQAEKLNPN